jgi:hypothetical protein
MYKGKKLVACSPVGRKSSMKCLFKHILNNKHVLDEFHLWVNTINQEDLEYINSFANQYPDFVHLKYGCDKLDPDQMGKSHNVKRFYNYCTESDTFYFKIDDDVIFIEDGTFEKLAQYKIDNAETFLTFPIIINNPWSTHFLRINGVIDVPECSVCTYTWKYDFEKSKELIKSSSSIMSDNLYEPKLEDFIPEDRVISKLYCFDSHLAYNLLNEFYKKIIEDELSSLDIGNIVLDNYETVCINFVMWAGEDFAKFNGDVKSVGDEPWLATFYPCKFGLKNSIVGNTRVVHYAFWPQRDYLNTTDIMEKYKKLLEI